MVEDPKKQAPLAVRGLEETIGIELLARYASEEIRLVDLTLRSTQDMTPIAADTMKEVAESTYAVPAREETKRAAMTMVVNLAGIGAAAFVVIKLLPKLTDPVVVGTLFGIGIVIFGVLRIIKALKGGD